MEKPTKPCEVCGAIITKPVWCSRADWPMRRFCSPRCKAESQRGQVAWNKGRRSSEPSRKRFLSCRICGAPTRYHGRDETNRLAGQLHCEKPECMTASRALKNAKIGDGQRRAHSEGRKIYKGWKHSGVSTEEATMAPWFKSLGWSDQFPIKPGAKRFRLDFADPDRMLFVEIDGSSHRHADRQERDRTRDESLGALGWRGLRLTAAEIRSDTEAAKSRVLDWIADPA